MKASFKEILKYTASFSFAGVLVWYVYKDQNMGEIMDSLRQVRWEIVLLSIVVSWVSHLSRGIRWTLALKPPGYQVPVPHAFLAVMAGYFGNLFLPRAGELIRCGALNKSAGTPVNISFGAVVSERILDLVMLGLISAVTVLVEFKVIGGFLVNTLGASADLIAGKIYLLLIAGAVGLVFLVLLYLNRQRLKELPGYAKVVGLLTGFSEGLLSMIRLSRAQQAWFVFHTLNIWLMYFLMGYLLFFSMPTTSHLGVWAGLSVLIMGGLGMAVPTPGGVGSYHLFVTATMLAYGISEPESKSFALLMHGSQSVSVLILGGISLAISLLLKRQRTATETAATPETAS